MGFEQESGTVGVLRLARTSGRCLEDGVAKYIATAGRLCYRESLAQRRTDGRSAEVVPQRILGQSGHQRGDGAQVRHL